MPVGSPHLQSKLELTWVVHRPGYDTRLGRAELVHPWNETISADVTLGSKDQEGVGRDWKQSLVGPRNAGASCKPSAGIRGRANIYMYP